MAANNKKLEFYISRLDEKGNLAEHKISLDELQTKFNIEYIKTVEASKDLNLKKIDLSEQSSFLSKILSLTEFSKTYRFLLSPEKSMSLVELSKKVGHGIVAREDIPKNTILCQYSGVVSSFDESDPKDDYIMAATLPAANANDFIKNLIKYTACISSNKKGNLSRFFQHLPAKNPFPGLNISTENVTTISVFDDNKNLPVSLIVTKRKIKKGEQIGFDYGDDYWEGKKYMLRYFFGLQVITCTEAKKLQQAEEKLIIFRQKNQGSILYSDPLYRYLGFADLCNMACVNKFFHTNLSPELKNIKSKPGS